MPRHLQLLYRIFQRELLFRREFGNLPVCALGDAGKLFSQILMRIDTASVATFDNRVDHGAALSGLGVSEKRPVLLAESCRSNRIFHTIVVDFDTAIGGILGVKLPLRERVADGFPKCARWEMPLGGLHFFKGSLELFALLLSIQAQPCFCAGALLLDLIQFPPADKNDAVGVIASRLRHLQYLRQVVLRATLNRENLRADVGCSTILEKVRPYGL
jgi:hypothetical protein